MKTEGNTILVTGGGTGIGEALAHRFHDAGNTVIVAGRRREALERAAAGRARMHVAEFDVADAADIVAFADRLVAAHPALNILVNNAGIMRFEDTTASRDLADAEAMVATNILGPIRMTDALIGHLTKVGGVVVNVTSGLAFLPLADAPTYSATKAAMHSYTLALREKLRGRIEVLELVPPGVQTDLTPNQATRPGYLPLADYIDEVMANWASTPTPPEILVERVLFQRNAEREGRFDASLTELNERARAARASQGEVR